MLCRMATATLLASSTPQDYHRIVSHTLTIPNDPKVPIPVGILACQRDPLLRSIDTTVIRCAKSQPLPIAVEKKAKKAVLSPKIPDDPILEVILHDTVIFPEGGGQPTDIGIITTSDGMVWEVVQAKRHGGHAVHYVRAQVHDVDLAILAFSPGSKVTASLDQAGYDRRYDHMSMHTSQHLLSALLETRLNLPTLSWSLTTYPTPCYVEVPRGMTQDEIMVIQNEANKLVFEGRRVHVEVEELDQHQENANSVPVLDSGRAVGKALPHDYTGGIKRVVIIDGVDKNPCCGTHLPSIKNLQLFLLPHTDTLSRSSTTTARLYFLAGPRLIMQLTLSHSLLTSAASILSCGASMVPERLGQVINERKRAEKRVSDVEDELADHISKKVIDEMASKADGSLFTKHIHRIDDSGNALGFLSSVAFALTNYLSGKDAVKPFLIIFSSSPSTQTINSLTTVLVLGSNDMQVKELGDKLKTTISVKGGGKGFKWSGKYLGVWKESKESVLIEDILNAIAV